MSARTRIKGTSRRAAIAVVLALVGSLLVVGGHAAPAQAGLAATAQAAAPVMAYTQNAGDRTVSVIDPTTNTVASTLGPFAADVNDVAVSPDGTRLYVVLNNSTISVIDTATNTEAHSIYLRFARVAAVSTDGTRLYATGGDGGTRLANNNLTVIDTTTYSTLAVITVGDYPMQVVASPDGARVYVSLNAGLDGGYGYTTAIDTATNTVVANVPIANGTRRAGNPQGLAVTPDSRYVYAAVGDDPGTVQRINTRTFSSIRIREGQSFPWRVAITPNGLRAYVTNANDNTVSVIDTVSRAVIATIPMPGDVWGVAVAPDGLHAYVTNNGGDALNTGRTYVIDTASNTLVDTNGITVGPYPRNIHFPPYVR